MAHRSLSHAFAPRGGFVVARLADLVRHIESTSVVVMTGALALLVGACADEPPEPPVRAAGGSVAEATVEHDPSDVDATTAAEDRFGDLGGLVSIDGSSTVFPISEAVAARFERLAPAVEVRLGVSGTGGGFQTFCRGTTDISDASRPIKDAEAALCAEHGVRFIELPVAFDGVSVVAHRDADWVRCMTLDELRRTWSPDGEGVVRRWSDVRADWPDRRLALHAPGRDSGTFDYFTRAVVGTEGSSRGDFVGSEDDYLLAQDIAADPDGLGFFGFAYYREYEDRLRLIGVDAGAGCVAPSETTIADGTYRPLARPLFIYVSTASLERPEVAAFVDTYLDRASHVVGELGYVSLPPHAYDLGRERLERRAVGSVFEGGSQVGMSIETLLEMESDGASP